MASIITPSFISNFTKSLKKLETVSTSMAPPSFWIDTGNLVLNKILSGSFRRGIPQGRISTLAGPSGSGKSYIAGNVAERFYRDVRLFRLYEGTTQIHLLNIMRQMQARAGTEPGTASRSARSTTEART